MAIQCKGSYKAVDFGAADKDGYVTCAECGQRYSLHTRPKLNIQEYARGAQSYIVPEHSYWVDGVDA